MLKEVGKPSLTILVKKSDNQSDKKSKHSKSFNFSGFNPILQKFYKMICKMIISKTVRGILLIFVDRVLLIISQ